jgi:hypothetical protein
MNDGQQRVVDGSLDMTTAPLPSRLPADLHIAITRLVSDASPSSSPTGIIDDSPSLTTQLSRFFPSVQSLTQLDIEKRQAQLRLELAEQERYIESLYNQLVINLQSSGLQDVTQPQAYSEDVEKKVEELLQLLASIREKARSSEEVVRDITRDIRKLDTCKRNVVSSMTALKRLQMLVNAVSQLDRLTTSNRLREAASALSAVKSLQSSFKAYAGVERVANIQRDVLRLQQDLKEKSRAEVEAFFAPGIDRPARPSNVADAVLVVDALGGDAITSVIDYYTGVQLREYRRIFRATDEAGQLDNVARRFAWFRRILKMYDDEHARVFEEGPIKAWNVSKELIRKFTEITREDLRSVLIRNQGKVQVSILLEALNACVDYERVMSKRLGMPFADICAASTSSSAAVKAQTTLSSAFDPYLGLFVEAQDSTLTEMIQSFKRQGLTRTSGEQDREGAANGHQNTVSPSSTELFYFYRQVLEQCARLSNREPFRDLCAVYKKHLRSYADEVLKSGLYRSETSRKSMDTRSNIADLQRYCMIINTADYCATTSKQLEDKLKEKIHPDFVDLVDLDSEREIFLAIISVGILSLTREVEICTESAFTLMLRPAVPWSSLEYVSSKSAYVDEFASALEHVAVVVRQDIENKRYVRNWCDKVVGSILARFMFNIVKLKPISTEVAKQLVVDIGEIRVSLLELPRYSLSEEGSTSAASSYNRYVSRGIKRIETLLNTISTPAEPAEELIHAYIRLVGDRSFSNFQKVLDLKVRFL